MTLNSGSLNPSKYGKTEVGRGDRPRFTEGGKLVVSSTASQYYTYSLGPTNGFIAKNEVKEIG